MTAEATYIRFPGMSIFGDKSLSEECFFASSDDTRNEYEALANKQIKLKRKLKELEAKGKKNSSEYSRTLTELRETQSKLR